MGFGRDTFYWVLKFPEFKETIMTSGTLWIGYIWTSVFGDSLVSIRLLAWITNELSLITFYLILIPKKLWLKYLPILSICIILMGYGWQHLEFSPTPVSVLFLSVIAASLVKYIRTNGIKYIFAGALLSAMATACRFPNIVSVFMVVCVILMNGLYNKFSISKTIKTTLVYILCTIALYFFTVALLTNTFDIGTSLYNAFKHAAVGSHSTNSMINVILGDLIRIINYIGICFLFFTIFKLLKSNLSQKIKIFFSICLWMFFVFYFVRNVGFHKWNNVQLYYFLSAISISFIIYLIFENIVTVKYDYVCCLIALLSIGIVAPLGSDTGLIKLYPMFVVYLPWLFFLSNKKINIYIMPLLVTLLLFVMVCYIGNPVTPHIQSIPLYKNTVVSNNKKLNAILITPKDKAIFDDYISDYNEYATKGNVAIYGLDPNTMVYLCDEKNKAIGNFYALDMNDTTFVNQNAQLLNKDRSTVFVLKPCNTETLFYKMLTANGYVMVKESLDNYVFVHKY